MKKLYSLFGFTLIELLVTLAIAGIIVAFAAPSFTSLISSNNTDNAIARLASSFAYARSEAITQSTNVTVCASADGASCGVVGDWGIGWITHTSADAVVTNSEILKVEMINSLSVVFTIDNNFASVCFDNLGSECNASVASATFTATANGQSSSLELYGTGAVGL